MTKQILSEEVEDYVKKNPKSVLLDVRTEEEWNIDGKPDGEKILLKTHFLTIQFADKTFNQNFIEDFKKSLSATIKSIGKKEDIEINFVKENPSIIGNTINLTEPKIENFKNKISSFNSECPQNT